VEWIHAPEVGSWGAIAPSPFNEPSPTIQAHGVLGRREYQHWIQDDGKGNPVTEPDENRPPYRVPTMAEVAALRATNGYRMVSTFSGCGGSCFGFEMAGYDVLWANEFVEAAQEVYRLNHPETHLDTRDIRDVMAEDILAQTGLSVGELDVFEGSPPCSAFSTSGRREAGWGKSKAYSDGKKQVVDDLFFEYARLLEGLQPRVFVAENVSGLVKGTAKGYMHLIVDRLESAGYRVQARLLDAQWLGVPQRRQRVIFQGVRKDLQHVDGGPLMPVYPKPFPYRYSINDALAVPVGAGIYDAQGNRGATVFDPETEPAGTITVPGGAASLHWQVYDVPEAEVRPVGPGVYRQAGHRDGRGPWDALDVDEPSPTILAGETRMYVSDVPDDQPETVRGYAIEAEWEKLRPGEVSKKYLNLIKSKNDQPAPTITASGGHPGSAGPTREVEKRKFTIAELKRICAFPDDMILTGTYAQQWERLGRSVPPLMMRAVAAAVRDEVLAKCAE
jgi:DNA (cytosine-5)-methyltransferase 1